MKSYFANSSFIKKYFPSILIGMTGIVLALTLLAYGGQVILRAQVEASDIFMVRADGARLGARPARKDIVIVHYDRRTATKLGYVHSYLNDLTLYRKLIDAGAAVVFDTRMIASATPEAFAEIKPLLDGMLAISDQGQVMRDVWLSSDLQAEHGGPVQNLISQNVINSHPHAVPTVGSRLYPLTVFLQSGVCETAPLMICRRVWDQSHPTSTDIGDELRRSGVMSKWHEIAPDVVPKTEVPSTPYRIGSHEIIWQPFLPATMLVPPCSFWVSYDPPISGFDHRSYIDIFNGEAPSDLKGKIVFVGHSADIDPTSDTYSVPNLTGKASAAEVVAIATQTLLDNRNMHPMPVATNGLIAAVFILGITFVASITRPIRAIVAVLFGLIAYYFFAVLAYRWGWYADFLVIPAIAIAASIPAAAVSAWISLLARQRVVDLFGRYVPRAIVNELIQRSQLESLRIGGEKREVAVMFADIRGFTDFSQDMPPEEVVIQLNSLLEIMVNCTFENEGTLDKFIGDEILVLFNVPIDQANHVERAVKTAISIQRRLVGHYSGLKVGIGIHRGEAVVGNIGTPQRMEYTAIGSTVNIASRLCDLALPGEVIVSQPIVELLPNWATAQS